MKILRGNLTETRYDFPSGTKEGPMRVKSERIHKENAVAYMADELGVHRVSNQGSDFAVSLHREWRWRWSVDRSSELTETVYTPPNVAKGGCYIFDAATSRRSHVSKCGYFSAFGKRVRSETDDGIGFRRDCVSQLLNKQKLM
jgi:Cysteine dioxygenase type I